MCSSEHLPWKDLRSLSFSPQADIEALYKEEVKANAGL